MKSIQAICVLVVVAAALCEGLPASKSDGSRSNEVGDIVEREKRQMKATTAAAAMTPTSETTEQAEVKFFAGAQPGIGGIAGLGGINGVLPLGAAGAAGAPNSPLGRLNNYGGLMIAGGYAPNFGLGNVGGGLVGQPLPGNALGGALSNGNFNMQFGAGAPGMPLPMDLNILPGYMYGSNVFPGAQTGPGVGGFGGQLENLYGVPGFQGLQGFNAQSPLMPAASQLQPQIAPNPLMQQFYPSLQGFAPQLGPYGGLQG